MSWMSAKPLALLLGLLAVAGGEKFADGVQHFRAGRYEKSYALLREVEKSYGDDELPSALLVDLALAACQTGHFDEAEGYAERVAARDPEQGYLRDQVVGASRLYAARKATHEAPATDPKHPVPVGPDIKKLDEGLNSVRRAIEAFGSAILARPDALEARRNLERALDLEKELEKKKKEAEDKKKKEDEKKKNDKDKKDKDKKDQQQKDQQKKDQQKKDQQKKDQQKKDEEKKDENKQDEKNDKKGQDEKKQPQKPDAKDQQKQQPLKQLSPEEKKRLEKVLEEYEQALIELKKSRAPKHQPGKKDW